MPENSSLDSSWGASNATSNSNSFGFDSGSDKKEKAEREKKQKELRESTTADRLSESSTTEDTLTNQKSLSDLFSDSRPIESLDNLTSFSDLFSNSRAIDQATQSSVLDKLDKYPSEMATWEPNYKPDSQTNNYYSIEVLDFPAPGSDLPTPPEPESDLPDPASVLEAKPKPEQKGLLERLSDMADDADSAISYASYQAGGAITGFLEAGLETVGDTAMFAGKTTNTTLDIFAGPVVDLGESALGMEAPSWLPDAQRGHQNYNKAADALATMVTNPSLVADAVIEPIKTEWNAGNEAEAVGRGVFEFGSLLVGGMASKISKGEDVGTADELTDIPTLEISRSKMSNIADNIEAALADGAPDILHREANKSQKRKNRREALDGQKAEKPKHSLDEYPFASSKEGGSGARTAEVPQKEQDIQGGTISSFYRDNNIKDNDPYRVKVEK